MPARYVLNRLKRFLVCRVLNVDDAPRRIAPGAAIGSFVTWTPGAVVRGSSRAP